MSKSSAQVAIKLCNSLYYNAIQNWQNNYFHAVQINKRHNNLSGICARKNPELQVSTIGVFGDLVSGCFYRHSLRPVVSSSQLSKCRNSASFSAAVEGNSLNLECWVNSMPWVVSREVMMISEAQLRAKTRIRQVRHSPWAQNLRKHQKMH